MDSDGARTAIITGGFTLIGAVIAIAGTAASAALGHKDQSTANRASHIQAFSEAMRESIPTLTKPNNDQAIMISLTSLVELSQAGDPTDEATRLEEETEVVNIAGSIKSKPVQAYLFGFLNSIPNGKAILSSSAPEEYYELLNVQDQKIATSKRSSPYVDATPQTIAGITPEYKVPISTIGWIYLGRGDFTRSETISQLMQPSSIEGNVVPVVNASARLSRNVHLRDARPESDKRLGRIIGVLRTGDEVQVLDEQNYDYGGSHIVGEAWAKVQVTAQ